MLFVLNQLLLRQCKRFFTYERRHRNLDPLLAGFLMTGAIATARPTPLPKGLGDALSWTDLRLPKTCPAAIGRIAQHAPHRRSLPSRGSGARRRVLLIQ